MIYVEISPSLFSQTDHAEALSAEQKRVQSLNDKLSDMVSERRELESELDTLKFRVTEAVSKRTEMEATLGELEKKVRIQVNQSELGI